jgi:glycosyltransferase involved in cell wall biosynthesis
MPLVWRRLGPVPVTIVGASVPPEVAALSGPQVDVTGWLPELDPALDAARVMVAPLSWGAGLKGKITQSLAAGLPVVTTSIGAEGLQAADGEQILIGETDEELAEAVIRLLTDDELWTSVSAAGQKLAEHRWSPEVMRMCLAEILQAASDLRAGTYGESRTALSGA